MSVLLVKGLTFRETTADVCVCVCVAPLEPEAVGKNESTAASNIQSEGLSIGSGTAESAPNSVEGMMRNLPQIRDRRVSCLQLQTSGLKKCVWQSFLSTTCLICVPNLFLH